MKSMIVSVLLLSLVAASLAVIVPANYYPGYYRPYGYDGYYRPYVNGYYYNNYYGIRGPSNYYSGYRYFNYAYYPSTWDYYYNNPAYAYSYVSPNADMPFVYRTHFPEYSNNWASPDYRLGTGFSGLYGGYRLYGSQPYYGKYGGIVLKK